MLLRLCLALALLLGSLALPGPHAYAAPTKEILLAAMAERTNRVAEFRLIREEAAKLGVRAWLFGGTAAAYGHYVKWDLERESGQKALQPERFDYDYLNIYRSTQDLDIVIDGTPEQAEALQKSLMEKYPHLQGSKSAWEVRLLRKGFGDKLAILDNPDFLNQHSDSNSTGMVEISNTPPGEPVVRDVMDWDSKDPHFLRDVRDGKLHYYFNPKHKQTKFFLEGRNPPILSVVRYLTKAFQYQLDLRPEDLKKIREVIDAFDPRGPEAKNPYVANWLLRKGNGRKLVQNAVDMEYAIKTLNELGLRQKLSAIANDPKEVGSLAWWLNKKPLPTLPLGTGTGKTAAELGISVVAHDASGYLAYESIRKPHSGAPNVFVSRTNAAGEMAAYGEGFYTAQGRAGARSVGYTVRFTVNANAREGTDFLVTPGANYVVFRNRAAFRIIPENFDWDLGDLIHAYLSDSSISPQDRGIIEITQRKIENRLSALSNEELKAEVRRGLSNLPGGEASPADALLPFIERQPRVNQALLPTIDELPEKDWRNLVGTLWSGTSKAFLTRVVDRGLARGRSPEAVVESIVTAILQKDDPYVLENPTRFNELFQAMPDLYERLKAETAKRSVVEVMGKLKPKMRLEQPDVRRVKWLIESFTDSPAHLDALAEVVLTTPPIGTDTSSLEALLVRRAKTLNFYRDETLARIHKMFYPENVGSRFIDTEATRYRNSTTPEQRRQFPPEVIFRYLLPTRGEPEFHLNRLELVYNSNFIPEVFAKGQDAHWAPGAADQIASEYLHELSQAKTTLPSPKVNHLLDNPSVQRALTNALDTWPAERFNQLIADWDEALRGKNPYLHPTPHAMLRAMKASRHWNGADPRIESLVTAAFGRGMAKVEDAPQLLNELNLKFTPRTLKQVLEVIPSRNGADLASLFPQLPQDRLAEFGEILPELVGRSNSRSAFAMASALESNHALPATYRDPILQAALRNFLRTPFEQNELAFGAKDPRAFFARPELLDLPGMSKALAAHLAETGPRGSPVFTDPSVLLPLFRKLIADPHFSPTEGRTRNFLRGMQDKLPPADQALYFDRLAQLSKGERLASLDTLLAPTTHKLTQNVKDRFARDEQFRFSADELLRALKNQYANQQVLFPGQRAWNELLLRSAKGGTGDYADVLSAAIRLAHPETLYAVAQDFVPSSFLRHRPDLALAILRADLAGQKSGMFSRPDISSGLADTFIRHLEAPDAPDWPEVRKLLASRAPSAMRGKVRQAASSGDACVAFFRRLVGGAP